jgi:hypothetical protein
MANPQEIGERGINMLGGWFDQVGLMVSAKMSSNVEFTPVDGRVVHLNESNEFEMGCHNTGAPCYLYRDAGGLDVQNPSTLNPNIFMHQAALPSGVTTAVVATHAYYLETTEYDDEQSYLANQLLTAAADNTDEDVGGVLTNAGSGSGGDVEQFVDPVCGIVAGTGSYRNEHGISVLSLFTAWLPGAYT